MSAPLAMDRVGCVIGRTRVLDEVSLEVQAEERLTIIGGNGAGKSTLARLALRLIRPDDGSVRLFGEDMSALADDALRKLRTRVGFVAQGGSLLGGLSVEDNLRLGLGAASGPAFARLRRRMDRVLFDFRLEHLHARDAWQLSTGERRRVELARAILRDPDLLVLDDPFDGADPETAAALEAQLLRSLARRPRALLLLTSDAGLASRVGGARVSLARGRIAQQPVSADPEPVSIA